MQLDSLSVNNASRLEIINVAMRPISTGNSPGGAIQPDHRGAFRLPKAVYSLSVVLNATSNDLTFKRTPGPDPNFKIQPNVRFQCRDPTFEEARRVLLGRVRQQVFDLIFSNMRDVFLAARTTTVFGRSGPGGENARQGWIDNPVIDRFELDDYQFTERGPRAMAPSTGARSPAEIRTNGRLSTMKIGASTAPNWRYTNGNGIKDWGDGFVTVLRGFQSCS